jgi:hydroxypyruvate reductase
MASPTLPLPPRVLLHDLFATAVQSALPNAGMIAPYLPDHAGRVLVLGAGKAAAAMASAIDAHWPDRSVEGLVITRYGHGVACRSIEVIEAAHPVPDNVGETAAERVIALARTARPGDLVVFVISGGASALLALPAPGLSLEDKRQVTAALLASGAPITAMNCVRKHLSAVKGGRLALAAQQAKQVTLLISDVPGDDPAVIGSGPTVPDPTTFQEARAVLDRYAIAASPAVERHLREAADETPKPGDPIFANTLVHVIARPLQALEAAAERARNHGCEAIILGDAIEGEARDVARDMARQALALRPAQPTVLLSGGETTVTVGGSGRGGRNAEFALSLALALNGASHIHAIACDTDGIDGSEDNAGAIIGPDSLARAQKAGLDLAALLDDNNAYSAFAALGDLVVTGPTRTNVNDFRAILVLPR